MEKKSCIFSCNCHNISFYPFLLPIIFMAFRFCKDQMIGLSKPEGSFKILKYNLPYLFYLYLPKILAIIFIPIIRRKTKDEHQEIARLSKHYHYVTINNKKKTMFFLIYIISLLEVIQETADLIVYYYQMTGDIKWLGEKKTGLIIFVPFLCYFILKIGLHRHHMLGLILGAIGAFIINFCRFPLEFSRIKDYPFHLLNVLFSFLLSLSLILIKYLLIQFVIISPYLFLFYDGIFCIINSVICILLEYIIVKNLPERGQLINQNFFINNFLEIFTIFIGQSWKFYIYFFVIFILLFVYYILSALTIYNFTPYLIIIVETCIPIDTDMIEIIFIKEKEIYNKKHVISRVLLQYIGYIILYIAAFILNEIFILNFCGFNINIHSKISSRGKRDSEKTLELYSKDDNETDENNSCLDETLSNSEN